MTVSKIAIAKIRLENAAAINSVEINVFRVQPTVLVLTPAGHRKFDVFTLNLLCCLNKHYIITCILNQSFTTIIVNRSINYFF